MGKLQHLGAGWGSWRYLAGATAKEKAWLLGVIQNRSGYGAWIAHLANGLGDKAFLVAFESEPDPWGRSKLVGEKIHELTLSFRKLAVVLIAESRIHGSLPVPSTSGIRQ